jgi:hypothetical protein
MMPESEQYLSSRIDQLQKRKMMYQPHKNFNPRPHLASPITQVPQAIMHQKHSQCKPLYRMPIRERKDEDK